MDYEKNFQAGNEYSQVILCLLSGPSGLHPLSCQLPRKRTPAKPSLSFRIDFTTQEYILSHCCFYTLHERSHAATWSSETYFWRSRTAFRTDTALGWFSLAPSSILLVSEVYLDPYERCICNTHEHLSLQILEALDCRALLCLRLVSRNLQSFKEYSSVGWNFTVMPACLWGPMRPRFCTGSFCTIS